MATMQVELVSPEAKIWSGEASYVGATTVEGSIGILPQHIPYLAELATGVLTIRPTDGSGDVLAAVHGGFLSVSEGRVTVLAEVAELAKEIDTARAREALSRAQADGALEEAQVHAVRRAETRLRAAADSIY